MQLFKNFCLVNSDFKTTQPKSALVVHNGIIHWIGPQSKVPKSLKIKKITDLKNKSVIPSFIECHKIGRAHV